MQYFRKAMAAPASLPEFKGNVMAVQTAPYWDDDLESLRTRLETLWPNVDAMAAEEVKKNPKMTGSEFEAFKMKAQAEHFTPGEWKRLQAGAPTAAIIISAPRRSWRLSARALPRQWWIFRRPKSIKSK